MDSERVSCFLQALLAAPVADVLQSAPTTSTDPPTEPWFLVAGKDAACKRKREKEKKPPFEERERASAGPPINRGDRELFKFPFADASPDATRIGAYELERLRSKRAKGYLNDELMRLWCQLVMLAAVPSMLGMFETEQVVANVFIFCTFFYSKFTESLNPNVATSRAEAHARVHRWTSADSIFQKKVILFPIEKWEHWSMVAILHPRKVAEHLAAGNVAGKAGGKFDAGEEYPCIVIMDSCQNGPHSHEDIAAHLRIWLALEWHHRCTDKSSAPPILTKDLLPLVVLKVCQQKNIVDCGLFALRSTEELLLRVLPEDFSVTRANIKANLKMLMAKKWYKCADIKTLRQDYTSLVMRMTNEFRQARDAPRKA
ncbi:hypothetical protein M885DRAFT_544985 [Pelagophyceae sp. CCMP2097]|nr:hypothetical protein M885DRAFT_544985 [Pelagophyceae sp. CCMP2097]